MALGIDGLVSGLDTTALINSLMQAEAIPQAQLKNKAGSTQSFINELKSLNTSLANLATTAKKSATLDALRTFTASASASSVSISTTAGAAAGSISVRVEQLAQRQVSVTAATVDGAAPAALTLIGSDGTRHEIATEGGSLADLAQAITASGSGVTATRVAAGTDPDTGAALYRLQLSSTETGEAGAFRVYAGTAADLDAGTAPDLLDAPGAATVATAQDAAVTLWPGSAAAQRVTSADNTFTDLLPGVNVTVTKVEADPVTLSVTRDKAATSAAAATLVASVGGILTLIDSKMGVTTSVGDGGGTAVRAGSFTGDSTVREARSSLQRALSDPIDGRSPSELGISITREGTFEFDKEKFEAALASDPAGTEAALATMSARVETAAKSLSSSTDGSITQRITGQESLLGDLTSRISDWDDRLETRRVRLVATYATLETQLSRLQSQSNYLATELAQMMGSK